jgi:DNA-binding SARP family transcriptional activator
MDIHLLGPVQVVDDGRPLTLGGAKQRALLALLALNVNRGVAPARLIDELWGERPPATATKALQIHVSRLRRALPAGVIHTRPDGYALVMEADRVDAARFERLVAAGAVEEALALWRGAPVADLADEPFAGPYVERLRELRLGALEARTDAWLASGRHEEAIAVLEALIAEEPYRERLRAQLMLALYRADRQADALEAFHAARRTLLDDLGLEPGERLRALQRGILQQSLPTESPFAGRERELARLRERWAAGGGCVLIAGEAGIGKTRLAAQFAGEAHGATVLHGRCSERLAIPFEPFVEALGELPGTDRPSLFKAVADRLAERPALLVLDDLQWADPPTLALLRHLVLARVPRVLILALYRDQALDEVRGDDRLVLAGLDAEAVTTLLPTPDRALADRLVAATAGNPFYLGELIAHPGASVRDVILVRERRLSPATRAVLRTAAVVGLEFSVRVLEPIHPGDALLDALDEARTAGLIAEHGHGDYAFQHALVRRALYDDLAAIRRARLHARVGAALEAAGGTVQELAHHFAEAADDGHGRRAAEYAIAAGREAIRRGGYEQAVAHYRRGLRALEAGGERRDSAGRAGDAVRRGGARRFGGGRRADAALRRELVRLLRQTRYEPLPGVGGLPAWVWGRMSRAGRVVAAAGAVALAGAAAAVAPALVHAQHERAAAEARRERARDAAMLASVNAEQRPHFARGPAGDRAGLLEAVGAAIRADATRRGEAILRVECEAHRDAGSLACLAVTRDVAAQSHGRPYRASVAFESGRFAYCRISPRAAKVLRAETPLPAACDRPGKVQGQPG